MIRFWSVPQTVTFIQCALCSAVIVDDDEHANARQHAAIAHRDTDVEVAR